jgi:hypothetical protein
VLSACCLGYGSVITLLFRLWKCCQLVVYVKEELSACCFDYESVVSLLFRLRKCYQLVV